MVSALYLLKMHKMGDRDQGWLIVKGNVLALLFLKAYNNLENSQAAMSRSSWTTLWIRPSLWRSGFPKH